MGKGYNPNRGKDGRFAEGKRKLDPAQINPPVPQLPQNSAGKNKNPNRSTLSDFVDNKKVTTAVRTSNTKKETPHVNPSETVFPEESPATPVDIQDRIYQARKAKQNPLLLAILSKDNNSDVRATIASREDVGEEVLDTLADDKDTLVLANVARNKQSTAAALRKIFKKCENDPKLWAVKCVLAQHKNLPQENLVTLTKDPDRLVASTAIKILKGKENAPH